MTRTPNFAIWSLMAALAFALPAAAQQGVDLKRGAVVYFGSAHKTTAPATIDFDQVRAETPEWQKIQSDGIRKGSGRYRLLITKMDKRIRVAARETIGDTSNDLVVREGDISNARGKDVEDLTDEVIERLDSEIDDPAVLESGPRSA